MKHPRALLLDCDGVLADTELEGHLPAFNEAFEKLGLTLHWTPEQYHSLLAVGGGKERLAAFLNAHPDEAPASDGDRQGLIGRVHRLKSELYVQRVRHGALPARPGVRRLIAEALDTGWQVAVASTSAPASVEAVLGAVVGPRLRARMAGIFAGDVVAAKKPAPDIYELALRELGRSPEDSVIIEDSGAGATAAARSGTRHVVTLSHFTVDDTFPAASAVLSDLGDVGAPARLVSGTDVRNSDGVVDLATLEKTLFA
ncbi:HAD-IA family hydrolase [Pseudonocardia sp. C8]|uniref:HAD-IA family hydrolase n=1 Tax=Pseudonocardia sp. C8 TaxID=2762759 RepID=UPI00164303D0|nr:HAD-IA family hydrolase [Pseudonocardia sp. C8]MBC3190330.1 HAD-IA family hydrolase [Pseudonocardia sp. C8]